MEKHCLASTQKHITGLVSIQLIIRLILVFLDIMLGLQITAPNVYIHALIAQLRNNVHPAQVDSPWLITSACKTVRRALIVPSNKLHQYANKVYAQPAIMTVNVKLKGDIIAVISIQEPAKLAHLIATVVMDSAI
jgi:hypothetical protein